MESFMIDNLLFANCLFICFLGNYVVRFIKFAVVKRGHMVNDWVTDGPCGNLELSSMSRCRSPNQNGK